MCPVYYKESFATLKSAGILNFFFFIKVAQVKSVDLFHYIFSE